MKNFDAISKEKAISKPEHTTGPRIDACGTPLTIYVVRRRSTVISVQTSSSCRKKSDMILKS
jgi:hypothetical protein